jgi:protocatechuate 3,4-dioxygenase beta subunit
MKTLFYLPLLLILSITGCSQTSSKANKKVGGRCEGCEAIHESPVPFEKLTSTVMLPDWDEKGTKLAINGVVYKADGTPAPNVIIYVYHTDQTGRYSTKGNEKGWGKRHGYIRGWVRTNEKGEYKFSTLKPAPYPNAKIPAHIHITIKEPGLNEYYIDEFLFDDDPLLSPGERKKQEGRGGSGIIKTIDAGNMLKAVRNIYLGKNIPDYP